VKLLYLFISKSLLLYICCLSLNAKDIAIGAEALIALGGKSAVQYISFIVDISVHQQQPLLLEGCFLVNTII
jgi:hypothetical protein